MAKKTVKQQCDDCHGTGLYSGFCEAKNEAVVCHGCDGQGWINHVYTEFEGRKRKRGIKSIRISKGSFIATGIGGQGVSMTYAEFKKKHPEKNTS